MKTTAPSPSKSQASEDRELHRRLPSTNGSVISQSGGVTVHKRGSGWYATLDEELSFAVAKAAKGMGISNEEWLEWALWKRLHKVEMTSEDYTRIAKTIRARAREFQLRFESAPGGSREMTFFRNRAGQWFAAETANNDEPCPADAEPLSAREALELFLERVDNSDGSLGDMNDAIRDLLRETA